MSSLKAAIWLVYWTKIFTGISKYKVQGGEYEWYWGQLAAAIYPQVNTNHVTILDQLNVMTH